MIDRNNRKNELGVAFSGGGLQGIAHIGAVKALYELGIVPRYVSGTSSGSAFAALVAMGYSAEEMTEFAKKNWKALADFHTGELIRELASLKFSKKTEKDGLRDGKMLSDVIKSAMDAKGIKGFEDLPINLSVCTNDTFTTDEWEAMTPQEQMDYFAAVSGQEVSEHIAAQPQVQEVHHYHHAVADQPAAQATAQHNEANQGDHFILNNDTHSTADSDVRIVATSEVEQVGDGTYAQHLEIDGHAAVALGDQQGPDVVVIDINDNRQLDPHDVIIDLQSEQVATVGDVVAQVQAQDPGYVTAGYEEATVDTVPTVDPNLHEVDYDPMDPANDPMLMDDGIDDLGMDMASDVPVYDC